MNHGVHCSHYNRRHMIVRYIGIYYLFIESTNILVVVVDVPVYCVLHNNDWELHYQVDDTSLCVDTETHRSRLGRLRRTSQTSQSVHVNHTFVTLCVWITNSAEIFGGRLSLTCPQCNCDLTQWNRHRCWYCQSYYSGLTFSELVKKILGRFHILGKYLAKHWSRIRK